MKSHLARRYPRHWRMPTEKTLEQHVYGVREAGLMQAHDPRLSAPTEYIPINDIETRQVRSIIWHMHKAIRVLRAGGYGTAGLSAVQIGEPVRISMVPHPNRRGRLLTVINGNIEDHPGVPLGRLVPHGCHSGDEVFAKLRVPSEHTLKGYNIHGEPISIARTGFATAVDKHEIGWHENGIRAMDIALGSDPAIQLDWRPPEEADAYREFFDGNPNVPEDPNAYLYNADNLPDWHKPFPKDQWLAKTAGEFVLMNFVDQAA